MPARAARWLVLTFVLGCGAPTPATVVPFEPGPPPVPPIPTELPPLELPPETAVDEVTDPPPGSGLGTTGAPAHDLAHACESADECVLVTGMCAGITAANRAHAIEVQTGYDALASVSDCGRLDVEAPVDPACVDHVCTTSPATDAELRTCARDRDCDALAEYCHWIIVSRTSSGYAAAQAAAQATLSGPQPPCVTPPMPELACRYHRCFATSAIVQMPTGRH